MIMKALEELIGGSVDPDTPLLRLGLDSLATIELRQKLQVRCRTAAKFCTLALHIFSCELLFLLFYRGKCSQCHSSVFEVCSL